MATTKSQKLAKEISNFRDAINSDILVRQQKWSGVLSIANDEFQSDLWLNCENVQERQFRLTIQAVQYEDHRTKHKVFYEQYCGQNSTLSKNLLRPSALIYKKWLQRCTLKTDRGHRKMIDEIPFRPLKNENLYVALWRTSNFIKKGPSRHYTDLAASYHQILVKYLFYKTPIRPPVKAKLETTPAYGLYILRSLGCSLEKTMEWQNQKFLTILPGRCAISHQIARRYVEALVDWSLSDSSKFASVGETILAIWILLACSEHGRRFCNVTDLFKIKESDICRHQGQTWYGSAIPPRYTIEIKGQHVPISNRLASLLLIHSDQRSN
jgi:hypothetical protein